MKRDTGMELLLEFVEMLMLSESGSTAEMVIFFDSSSFMVRLLIVLILGLSFTAVAVKLKLVELEVVMLAAVKVIVVVPFQFGLDL